MSHAENHVIGARHYNSRALTSAPRYPCSFVNPIYPFCRPSAAGAAPPPRRLHALAAKTAELGRPAWRRVGRGLSAALVLWGALAPLAPAQGPEPQALEDLRNEIRSLQQRVARQHVERDAGQQALRAVEGEISAGARELESIRETLGARREQARRLREETGAARERLARERQALAEQVRMSYMAGRGETLKLVLNQESPAILGRLLVYYDYLNRARAERAGAVVRELTTQERLSAESERVAADLAVLEQAQTEELETLVRARNERRRLVASIEQEILGADSEIRRLREEAQRLTQVVTELDALPAEFPADARVDFRGVRGRLAWPVEGSLVNDYGDSRVGGQLRWNGITVGAPQGASVRAVHHGRVVYADWLPGLGLLVILDHGAGYMSLYGHNEAILTESGDWVASGEAIGRVGNSGGQRQSALYFEIREHGEPVDPRPWMNARLPR